VLLDRGFSAAQTARIRAPVGLTLGCKTPHAIAASTLAEVVKDLSDQGKDLPEIMALQDAENRSGIGAVGDFDLRRVKPKEGLAAAYSY